tara:strand:- start:120 stop:668 length:549 start_codon:yes stop_codon:yes gene_type:complete
MLKNLDFSSFNYLEIDILKNNDEINNKNIINVNWSKNDFINLLRKLMNSNIFRKPFEKQYRVLKYLDLIYIKNISDNKYNLYSLTLVDKEIEDNLLYMKYKKNNLGIFQFPSTDKINDDFYLNKIIFKITNLIYLNFEIMKKNDIEIFFRVYINFNNDKTNIDNNLIIKNLEDNIMKISKLF